MISDTTSTASPMPSSMGQFGLVPVMNATEMAKEAKAALDKANERLAALEGKTGEREKQDESQRTEQQYLDQ